MYQPEVEKPHPFGKGIQRIYRFPNTYAVSAIKGINNGKEDAFWEMVILVTKAPDGHDIWEIIKKIKGLTDETLENELKKVEMGEVG